MNTFINCYSTTNPWIDCIVTCERGYEGQIEEALNKASEDFNEDDGDECYGDCIKTRLDETGVPYGIVFGEYDEETNCTTEEYEAMVRAIISVVGYENWRVVDF